MSDVEVPSLNAWLEDHPEASVVPVQYRPDSTTTGWLQRRRKVFTVDATGTIRYADREEWKP